MGDSKGWEGFEEFVEEQLKRASESSALKKQVGGEHYKDFVIQPVEFTVRNRLGFCEGNVIKYVCRHRKKGGLEDLKKAKHYLELLAELEYGAKI